MASPTPPYNADDLSVRSRSPDAFYSNNRNGRRTSAINTVNLNLDINALGPPGIDRATVRRQSVQISATVGQNAVVQDVEQGLTDINISEKEVKKGSTESASNDDTEEREWKMSPENPRNWPEGKKWIMASIVSLYTFISPVCSSMMAPALPQIAVHFHMTDPTLIAMTLSIFLLALALGPLLFGPLSEIYGRTWVLHLSNLFFLVFNLACAFAPNSAALIVFRFPAGIGGSAPIAIGGGSIGDLWAPKDRASAMAVFTLGPLLGPSIGPVLGGFISQRVGWMWIFVVLAALAGGAAVVGITFLRETYAPVIRHRRSGKTGNLGTWAALGENMARPFALLFKSWVCFILSLYMAIMYGYYYLMFTTFPDLFQDVYDFGLGISGLAYLGPGVGFMLSTWYGVAIADRIYQKMSAKNGGVGKPEYRLPALIFANVFVPIGLFWYGWSAQAQTHWIMPIIGAGIFSFGMMSVFLPISLYLVDAFKYAASATAAAAVFRSTFGFAFPLFGQQLFDALGNGGGYSLLAGLAIVTGFPAPIYIYFYGEKLRQRSNLSR